MMQEPVTEVLQTRWLIRISEVFADWEADILRDLGAELLRKLGRGYGLVRMGNPARLHQSAAARFVRWNLPVHHSWPCCPRDIPGFVEKAAQALWRKFGGAHPQTVLCGPLDPDVSNRYYKSLAANLRGRTLQLFPSRAAAIRDAGDQDPRAPTLFCLVGKEGLFCGMRSPADANGFHPGGTKYIRQSDPGAISRAGAKIAEALYQLKLDRPPPPAGGHWLELGASPGGMTAELLARGYRVTAVDRAALSKQLDNMPGLQFVPRDAATYLPRKGTVYDAVLSDMNGDALESITRVVRLTGFLRVGGLVVFTLKLPGVTTYTGANEVEAAVVAVAAAAGLRVLARTHLTYNRFEFTVFFEREAPSPSAGRNL